MGEEYFFPGGFMGVMKRFNPRFAPYVTVRMAIVINGLQLVLCTVAVFLNMGAPVFSMSVAGLLFINGLMHLGACIRSRGYSPGVVTGTMLYIPLAVIGYYWLVEKGSLSAMDVLITAGLGLFYQLLPISYLLLFSRMRNA
jgi:hypothetical protein